jgi:acyl carrier protein
MQERARQYLQEFLEFEMLAARAVLPSLPADANLLQEDVLNSLSFVEFLLFLEKKSGRQIDSDNIDSLMTLHGIGAFLSNASK